MPAKRRRARIVPSHTPRPRPVHPFDRLYGTETGGLIPRAELLTGHANDAHLTAYYGVAPSILDGLIDRWLETKPRFDIDRYTFYDVGAGKGRAMMAASLHPFLQVAGVELNPAMAAIARANLQRFNTVASPLSPASLLEADALESPLPDSPTLAFLFHPFEAPVLRKWLRKVESHAAPAGSVFDLLYVNAEHSALLDANPSFRRLFFGPVPMSSEDHLADLAEIAEQQEYGSTGDEICAIYRLKGDTE